MPNQQPSESLAAILVDHELSIAGIPGTQLVYEKTFAELAPILGARGVHGIFERAFELVRTEQPALRSFEVGDEPSAAASSLATCLSTVTRDVARTAAIALYSSFFGLIVTFIGFELTVRLLRAAWPQVELLKETP